MKQVLKNWFIPHIENNYQPKVLHPKQVLWQMVLVLTVKIILVGLVLLVPFGGLLSPNILQEQVNEIVAYTNEIRAEQKLPALQIDSLLTRAAQAKAYDMMTYQYFAHKSPLNVGLREWLEQAKYDYTVAGENLAMGFVNARDVVSAWKASPTHYANLIDPEYSTIGIGIINGKYVSADTIMIAQFFADGTSLSLLKTEDTKKVVLSGNKNPIKKVLGEKITKLSDTTQPLHVVDGSARLISQNGGEYDVVISLHTSGLVSSARATFGHQSVNLSSKDNDGSTWEGRLRVTSDEAEEIRTIVLPVSILLIQGDNQVSYDIGWSEIVPKQLSLFERYQFLHNTPSSVHWVFQLSSVYYVAMLIVVVVALILNIFIEIKKQHPHLIFSAISLIGLLILVILF